MKRLLKDTHGILYTYLVIIIALIAGIFFVFLFTNAIQAVQETLQSYLSVSNWGTTGIYAIFAEANNFVTNIWTYLAAFIIFIIGFWVYVYSQRKGAGY